MATTKQDIAYWFKEGAEEGATHMIVVCDTFDWSDYPVYVKEGENVKEIENKYHGKDMQKVMEVYNLKKPMKPQLEEIRSFNY